MRTHYLNREERGTGVRGDTVQRGAGSFWKRVLEDRDVPEARSHAGDEALSACLARAHGAPGGMEVRFEVGDSERRSVWRAESVELLSLRSGAKSVWAVETPDWDGAGAGKVYLPMAVEEPVYRMRVELSRVSGFDDSELWESPRLALPEAGAALDGSLGETEVDGAKIRVHSLTAPGASVPGELRDFWNRWTGEANVFTLWVEVKPGGSDRRLTLVSAEDETGSKATVEAGLWSEDHYAFGIRPPAGAKNLRFTFAVHRSRVVELVVDTRAWSAN